MSVRVLLADDQRVVREGLKLLLGLMPGVELVGIAEDGRQAVELAGSTRPQVILMDLRMPHMDGVEATRLIRQTQPGVHIVVLTTYVDDASVFAALRAGARGYLTKDAGAEEIAAAIMAVTRGDALLDPAVQARLLDALESNVPARAPGAVPDGLTAREVQVLELIAEGLTNNEIAGRLHVSETTIKTHINHIFSKTGVRDRAQAVAYAYRTGIASA